MSEVAADIDVAAFWAADTTDILSAAKAASLGFVQEEDFGYQPRPPLFSFQKLARAPFPHKHVGYAYQAKL